MLIKRYPELVLKDVGRSLRIRFLKCAKRQMQDANEETLYASWFRIHPPSLSPRKKTTTKLKLNSNRSAEAPRLDVSPCGMLSEPPAGDISHVSEIAKLHLSNPDITLICYLALASLACPLVISYQSPFGWHSPLISQSVTSAMSPRDIKERHKEDSLACRTTSKKADRQPMPSTVGKQWLQ